MANHEAVIDLMNENARLVKALEEIQQRANEIGTGEMALIDTIHAIFKIARDAAAAVKSTGVPDHG